MVVNKKTVICTFAIALGIVMTLPVVAKNQPKKDKSVPVVDSEPVLTIYELPDPARDAVMRKDIAALKKILAKNPKRINGKDYTGSSLLNIAIGADKPSKALIEFLISKGADVNAANIDTPLERAINRPNCSLEIVQLLFSKGAKIQREYRYGSPLYSVRDDCPEEVVKLLIKKGCKLNVLDETGYSPLHIAVQKGYLRVAKLFISLGADINIGQGDIVGTPLCSAVCGIMTDTSMADLLISHGAKIDARDIHEYTPLMSLVDSYPRYDKKRKPIKEFPMNMLNYLLSKGADINAADGDGINAVMIAAYECPVEIIEAMIARGARIDTVGKSGTTMLMLGAERPEVVSFLLAKGFSVNAKNNDSLTALMLAVCPSSRLNTYDNGVLAQKLDAAKILITNGANVNDKDKEGFTPLNYAVFCRSSESVSLLLTNGADVNTRDKAGQTPLYYAKACMSGESIIKLLKDHGAVE